MSKNMQGTILTDKQKRVEKAMSLLNIPENEYKDTAFSSMGCLLQSEKIEIEGIGLIEIGTFIDCIDLLYRNKKIIDIFNDSQAMVLPLFDEFHKRYYYKIQGTNKVTYAYNDPTGEHSTGVVKVTKSTKPRQVIFTQIDWISAVEKVETPKSVLYKLPKGLFKIKSKDKFVNLEAVLYNKKVKEWLRINYHYLKKPGKWDYKTLTVTPDHPLPLYGSKKIVKAKDLKVGDKLQRIANDNPETHLPYGEIVSIYEESTDELNDLEKGMCNGKSYDVTTKNHYFNVNDIYSHNCRSQLSVWRLKDHPEWIAKPLEKDERGYVKAINNKWYNPNKMIKYSRFNIGVTTINLPDVALSVYATQKDVEKGKQNNYKEFWDLLEQRLELCHRAIRFRFDYLLGTKAEVAPIQWINGNFARLQPTDTIDELLKNGFATASLGYVGLYETVKWLTGVSHTQNIGRELGMQIMQKLHDKCEEWKQSEPEHIGYSLYGTPEESLTEKFARALQKRHGIIKGITDKLYVTNSYHIPVFENIDAFSKLRKEAPFQDLSSGGNISYIEIPAMNKNIEVLLSIIKYIYDHNIYAEINTKLDYCKKCGYEGEILLIDDIEPKRYRWKCPKCGNTDINYMYIVRRICGYLANMTVGVNDGRKNEIAERVTHL